MSDATHPEDMQADQQWAQENQEIVEARAEIERLTAENERFAGALLQIAYETWRTTNDVSQSAIIAREALGGLWSGSLPTKDHE